MRIDQIYQFIVPLMFLAIWALTSLFNREAEPLPPRTGRPQGSGPGPNPPRPAGEMVRGADGRITPRPTGAQYASARPRQASPRPRPALGPGDGIVIIEPTQAQAARRPGGGSQGQPASQRGRAKPASARATPSEPMPARERGNRLTRSGEPATSLQQFLIDTPTSPTQRSMRDSVGDPVGMPADTSIATFSGVGELGQGISPDLFRSPTRIREAMIMRIVLGPPTSLRGRSRRL